MTRVALVVLDTLRKDAFEQYFSWLPGYRFEQAWSTAKWTMPAHASLFTGKYASEVGVNAKSEGLDCSEPALAELLSDAGFTTHAFSANLIVSPVFEFDRGFDSFEGTWRINVNSKGITGWRELLHNGCSGIAKYRTLLKGTPAGHYRILPSIKAGLRKRFGNWSTGPLLGSALQDDGAATFLASLRQNQYRDADFLFVNLMEAHAPYSPPVPYRETNALYDEVAATLTTSEPDGQTVRDAYDSSVHYLADQYQRIFAELTERFEYVITLSDHGELFGEHGSWRHLHGVYPELTHIPLVISGNGMSGNCQKAVSILDIHQTLLDLLDLSDGSRGQNLLDEIDDRSYLVEYEGLRSTRLERMYKEYPSKLVNLYDRPLRGLAGPNDYYGYETLEGWKEYGSSTPEEAQTQLQEITESIGRPAATQQSTVDVSEEVQARLEELGYF
ncbi:MULTISPECIES: sulfatase-like hydrolase/transferase [Natrialbaceae]|uniref:sulfatase-like hydrolase/transferase n=1 Tax=Natrialbaceae TaxID=1644061 RepID=UPI00207CD444|nr:sulfatase-like hydrolase/transferase [Natronococcus sp. CG52]